MRDERSGAASASPSGRPRAGLLRSTTTWLSVAVLILTSAGVTGLAAIATPASDSSAGAASHPAAWLWMSGPVMDGRTAAARPHGLAAQDPDATPAPGDGAATPDGASPSSSPSAPPTPDRSGTCYVPDREAAPSSPAEPLPSAEPVSPGDGTVITEATPAGATPAAAPAAELTRAGYPAGPASDLVARDIERVVESVSVCLSDGDYDTLNDLVQDGFRGQLLGLPEPVSADDFSVLAGELPPAEFTVTGVTDVMITEEGDATAVVRYLVGNQVRQGLWTFSLFNASASLLGGEDANGIVRASARWVVESEEVQNPEIPGDAGRVAVTLDEYTIQVEPGEVEQGTVALEIANEGDQDHEVIVLRLEGDATVDDLLYVPGPALPEGISIVGQLGVPAGEDGVMVLEGLEPDTYALVDLFPDDESGLPNLSLGMEAELEVGQ